METLISQSELDEKLERARLLPALAHLPAFGLFAPAGWDYNNPELLALASGILQDESIEGQPTEAAPALFWYETQGGELHCHPWK